MENLFSFQNDPYNKLRPEQCVKKIHHFLQVFKYFQFQTVFSRKPRSKELIHLINKMLIQPRNINCQYNSSSSICSEEDNCAFYLLFPISRTARN